MAIRNSTNQNNPSLEALISHAGNERSVQNENIGALDERVEVLPKLDGDTLASAREDLQRLLGTLRDARHSLFSPSEAFNTDDDPVIELHDDKLHDEGMTRLLADVAHMFMGLPDDDHEQLTHTNARPFGLA